MTFLIQLKLLQNLYLLQCSSRCSINFAWSHSWIRQISCFYVVKISTWYLIIITLGKKRQKEWALVPHLQMLRHRSLTSGIHHTLMAESDIGQNLPLHTNFFSCTWPLKLQLISSNSSECFPQNSLFFLLYLYNFWKIFHIFCYLEKF